MLKLKEVDELIFFINYRKKRNFNLFKKLLYKLFKNKIKTLKWSTNHNFLISLDSVYKDYYENKNYDSYIQKIYIFKNNQYRWFYNSTIDLVLKEKNILDFLQNQKFNTTCYVFLIDNNIKVFKFENPNLEKINFSLEEKRKKILKIKKLKI